ncbi:phosphodiester glycosidase family protein [Clostridium folliculivorans]|uniref:Exopolysaccharide biosynthesis protein n=1 Tax=Clostridium folliculivorans TaxID=2886038 RepID=A0A9W5Y283_9CLOT|nr:phosphodiester glycosidase family protein [Clostridium folliculivorans]GKU25401.1 exopolysaccharide biosynthesis protein [Clostridium folliculivorans]GKU28423.1 exopolysaccharide biosynthesis protein [Clostridium folliculivorans]
MKENKEKKRNLFNKISLNLFNFIFANIIIGLIIAIPMVFYGPFKNIKELVVTSAMTTLNHQYLATLFLNETEIHSIMANNTIDDSKNSNLDEISINNSVSTDNQGDKGMEVKEIKGNSFSGHLLIVNDAKRIQLGLTENLGRFGMKLDDIVKKENAVAGINAGGFQDENGQGNGGVPTGLVVKDGKIVFDDKLEEKVSLIGFNKDGIMVIGKYSRSDITRLNIKDAVSFSPFLVINGEGVIKSGNGGWGIAPRTAIGQRKDGTVLMLVIDGRQIGSLGATLKDVQNIMLENGAYNAANLDGGSSTTMVVDGKIINNPSSKDGVRFIPTSFIIK